jgi:hypothetical protein
MANKYSFKELWNVTQTPQAKTKMKHVGEKIMPLVLGSLSTPKISNIRLPLASTKTALALPSRISKIK